MLKLATEKLNAISVILLASQSIHEVVKKEAARYEMNSTEFAVLELLYRKGDQPIQVVGKRVLISSSSITYVIDKLVQKKFVARKACPADRRVIYASLTSAGQTLMDQIFPQHEQEMVGILDQLTEEDVIKMIEILSKVK